MDYNNSVSIDKKLLEEIFEYIVCTSNYSAGANSKSRELAHQIRPLIYQDKENREVCNTIEGGFNLTKKIASKVRKLEGNEDNA